jgi:peptidoglycan/xylan/chitin deacetylase (PgdA/CDA1 family)
MMVLTKRKLKKIISVILAIMIIIAGSVVLLSKNTQEVFNLMVGAQLPYERGDKKDSGYVALTCNIDLGWETEYVDKILAALEKENTKITFTVTGKWAEKNKDELLKIQAAGHEIGNHGYQHLDYANLSYEDNIKQISTSQKIIDDIIGQETKFFQAPAGAFGPDTVKAAKSLGYIPFKWDADTIDWKYRNQPQVIVDRIKGKDLKSGSIILMHPTAATSEAIDDIINIVRDKGLNAGRLSDVFNTGDNTGK